ncbi:glycosyltransferase [Syntrophotalea acetylenica]|uniref:glycosyltransferase n=1 Tax=Syntrophotalea acetylenica TaxID=29542 RepID=UPI000ABB4393|nr:glycosyltransferase [Syntrophotalea acetylenica]
MKKIAFLVPTLRFGGGERVAINLINGISDLECYEVSVIVYDSQIDYDLNLGIEVISLNEKTDLKNKISRFCSFFRKSIKVDKILKKKKLI